MPGTCYRSRPVIDGRILSTILGEDPSTMQLADGGHLFRTIAKEGVEVLEPTSDATDREKRQGGVRSNGLGFWLGHLTAA